MKKVMFISVLFLLSLCVQGYAEEIYIKSGYQSIEAIVEALAPASSDSAYKPRDLRSAVKAQKRAISMAINFKKNSSNLTTEAAKTLDILGQSLNREELKEFNFILEGHTDASGTESYNQALSQKRAKTVKEYLVSKYNISATRLTTEGKGETALYDPQSPYSGVNRRVRIVNNGR